MKKTHRLSRLARTDLLQIWKYLKEGESIELADRIIDDLFAGIDSLSKSPGIGHFRKDMTKLPIRFFRVYKYLILYAPQESPLSIVRVLHSGRDIPAILHGR